MLTIVAGVPRSGTSMMMQALEAAGVAPFVSDFRPPSAVNPRGFYEHEDVILGRRWDAPDGSAVKIIGLGVIKHAVGNNVILMTRDSSAIEASQNDAFGTVMTPASKIREIYRRIEQNVENFITVNYDDAIDAKGFVDLAERLSLDASLLNSVITPSLRRHA